jgi:hypothetical protein
MKWFKHMTDMLDDTFVILMMDEYGLAGYGAWVGLLEIYAKYAKENVGDWIEIPWVVFRQKLRCKRFHFERLLSFYQKARKIQVEIKPKSFNIKIPKMAEFRDEWSRKKIKNSGGDSGATPPKNTEADTDQETDSRQKNTRLPVPVSEFFEFAQKGQAYAVNSGNPNLHRLEWVAGYLENQFMKIRNSRPEIPAEAILQIWQQCCDDASVKAVGAAKWYQSAFENRVAEWKPLSNGKYNASKPQLSKPKHLTAWNDGKSFKLISTGMVYPASQLQPIEYVHKRVTEKLDAFLLEDGQYFYFADFEIA